MATPAVPTPPRDLTRDAFFAEEKPKPADQTVQANKFAATTTSQQLDNPLSPAVTAGLTSPEVIPKGFETQKGSCFLFLPTGFSPPASGVKLTLLFCVSTELNRHGLRTFFDGKSDRALITVPGVEAGWDIGGVVASKAWAIGITKAQIDGLFAAAGFAKATWSVSVMAGYSTGYRGVNGTINNALVPLDQVERLVYYDCLYQHNDPPPPKGTSGGGTARAIAALKAARGKNPLEIITYRVSNGGTPPGNVGLVPAAGLIDLQTPSTALTVLVCARVLAGGIADGYFTDAKVPKAMRPILGILPTRGTLASSALTAKRASSGTLADWYKKNTKLIDAAIKEASAAAAVMRADLLMGWGAPDSELRHDGFIPEFGWEYMPL